MAKAKASMIEDLIPQAERLAADPALPPLAELAKRERLLLPSHAASHAATGSRTVTAAAVAAGNRSRRTGRAAAAGHVARAARRCDGDPALDRAHS